MAVSVQITVTVPEIILNSEVVRFKIEQRLRNRTGPDLMRLFRKTVEGWEHQINFYQRVANAPDHVSVTVFTRFKQYAIVNFGSPPHTIAPKRGGLLRFQTGYRAATRPNIISSRAKQRFGAYVSSRGVSHPGFEARNFDIAIAKDIMPRFEADVQDAIAVGTSIF